MRRIAGLLLLAAVPVVVLGVFFALPVAGMLQRGLWPDGAFDPGAVWDVLTRPRTRRVVWFTVWTSTLATVSAVLLGLPAAYALHRLRFPLRGTVRALMLVPFVLPTVVVGIAVRQLLADSGPLGFLGLDGTPAAIVLGLVFFNVAVVVRTVGAAWEGLDRRPAEAAATLGATPWQVFRTVTLPALRPAIVSAASVVFLFCATAFGVVLVLGGSRHASVETEIYLLTTDLLDLPAAAALSIVQLLAVVALLGVAGRLRRVPDPTVRRHRAAPRRPGRGDVPALAATGAVLAFVATPIVGLVVASFRQGGAWSLAYYRALAEPGSEAGLGTLLRVPVTEALGNSLRIATDAAWMSLGLGLLVALVVTRRSRSRSERRVRAVLDGLFMLPLGVSAVTLGFGFLITLDQPPLDLRSSPVLVPMAQALVALPLVVRTLVPVLAGIDDRQRQAAASLGAGPGRTLLTVDLPVLWRPLLAAAGFAFAVSLGEFGATSFIVRAEVPTLPVVIFRLLGHPGALNYGTAMAASVVLAATTATVILLVERLRVPALGELLMLHLHDVGIHYDGRPVVSGVDLAVADGEVLAVLGPSGCGKSTLLRAVAGLEPLATGAVRWDGADQARTPAHRRGFVLMFQDGQLFDHLDVAANVEYALRRQGLSRIEARPRVAALLEFVGLDGEDHRMPRTLSGGERQRVALARSLAAEPRLLLLDEPLTALDAALRARLAGDLRRILADATALLVTHDQAEAFALADRVAVMREGRVVQQGTVEEVWSAPADAETALFLGYARVLEGDAARALLAAADALVGESGAPRVAVRRSAVTAAPGAEASGSDALTGEVLTVRPTPDEVHLLLRVDGIGEIEASGAPNWLPDPGARVRIGVHRDRIAALPSADEPRRAGTA